MYIEVQGSTTASSTYAIINIQFDIVNATRRGGVKGFTHASGISYAAQLCDKTTNQEIYSFSNSTSLNILAPGARIPISQVVSVSLDNREYRLYVYAESRQGVSTSIDVALKAKLKT